MKMDAIKSIKEVAELISATPREVFDNVVTLMLSYTLINPSGYDHLYLKPKFKAGLLGTVPVETTEAYEVAYLAVLSAMNDAAPFEDAITDYYGQLLRGDKGQFMTPGDLGYKITGFLDGDISSGIAAEPTCGTGSLALGHLRRAFESDGAKGVQAIDLILNDLDIRLLRIAIFQVMYHTIKNDAPVSSIRAWHADLIQDYDSPGKMVLDCTSHRRAIAKLTPVF